MQEYHIYCDESSHILHSDSNVMMLGAIWCPSNCVSEIVSRIREIKARHGHPKQFEIKWTKVSPAGQRFYMDIIDYFFDDDDLHYRGLVIPDKSMLDHDKFHQTHDLWYYKMYFEMLKVILNAQNRYRIFVDVKDTWSGKRVRELHKVLANNLHDFDFEAVQSIQVIRSEYSELIQLADLITGAVTYANRGLKTNQAKLDLVSRIVERSRRSLTHTTTYSEPKMNLLIWQPRSYCEG